MFGAKAPFGSATSFPSTSFGTAAPFGQNTSAFGANKTLGAGFGTQAFGAAPPNNTIFNTAGTSAGNIFGGVGVSSSFGQPGTSTSSFGFPATSSTSTGLFGNAAQAATGTSLFQSPTSSAFGAPKPTFGGFGATPSTVLFGQNQQPATLFSQNNTMATVGAGLFGTAGNSFSSGMTAFGTATPGTNGTAVKFSPVTGNDTMLKNGVTTNISIRHQCITIMKEYENKSLEELRVEDYLANRKGPQSTIGSFGTTNQPSMFGTNQSVTSTGLFQNQTKAPFGSAFGAAPGASTVFGQPAQHQTTALFGQKNMSFGAPSTTSSFSFGTSTAPALFGSTASTQNKSLFGTTNPTTAPSLFGTANTLPQGNAFGNTAFNTSFGAANPAGGVLFGTKPPFGTATTSSSTFAFGNNTNTSANTSLFSNKTNTGFGAATTFGPPASNFGMFGTGTNPGTSLFSQNKPPTSFGNTGTAGFGTNLNTFGTAGGSLFGTANKTGGLNLGLTGFGPNTGGSTLGMPSTFQPNATVLGSDQSAAHLAQQLTQAQQQLLALAQSPFGDSPLFRNILQDTGKREQILTPTNPDVQKAVTSNNKYKVSPHPTVKVRPKSIHTARNGKPSIFDGLDEDDVLDSTNTFMPRRSIKKLDIKPRGSDESEPSSILGLSPENSISEDHCLTTLVSPGRPTISPFTIPVTNNEMNLHHEENHIANLSQEVHSSEILLGKNPVGPIARPNVGHPTRNINDLDDTLANLNMKPTSNSKPIANDDSEKENISRDVSSDEENESDNDSNGKHPAGIVLRRNGYYTIPSLKQLEEIIDEKGNCYVENFTIGREGYGNVFFHGITNVANLNLDEIVHFRKKEIIVYPDDYLKPPLGEGLNKKAQITLDGVWPVDKTTCLLIKNSERLKTMGYQEKLERAAIKLGAKFLDYRPDTGSWVFEVKHFSKYGLEESDDDEEEPVPHDPKKQKVSPMQTAVSQIAGIPIRPLDADSAEASVSQTRPFEHMHINGLDHEMPHLYRTVQDDDDEMRDDSQNIFAAPYDADRESALEPPSHQLARNIGVSSQKMQVMKASFFHEDEEEMEEGKSSSAQERNMDYLIQQSIYTSPKSTGSSYSHRGGVTKSYSTLPSVSDQGYGSMKRDNQLISQRIAEFMPAPAKASTTSSIPENLSNYTLIPSSKLSPPRLRKIIPTKRFQSLFPLNKSLLNDSQKLIADSACFAGRRFRVGWGPNWTFTHCKSFHQDNQMDTGNDFLGSSVMVPERRTSTSSFSVTIRQIGNGVRSNNSSKSNLSRNLQIQLANSRGSVEDGCPVFVPSVGVNAFHEQAEVTEQFTQASVMTEEEREHQKTCLNVWRLCIALWGNITDTTFEKESDHVHAERMMRRKAFSEWLQSSSIQRIKNEIHKNSDDPYHLDAIFSHLSGCQINMACQLAHHQSDHRLALLLSQATGSIECRELVKKQLQSWNETKADNFITYSRLKIYALLAGCLVWVSSQMEVNTCEDVDWKRALGLHLWFSCSPVTSIPEALLEYKHSFKGTDDFEKYSQPPLPPYLENNKEAVALLNTKDDQFTIRDMCYHLLKLYVKRSHRLDRLLCPTTYSADHLDHRLSWLICQSLHGAGYHHLSKYQVNSLHLNFAAQLESMGLWHWAIFAVLHISRSDWRYFVANDLLQRHLKLHEDKEMEGFLREKLLIPEEWIHRAKALRAHHENKMTEEAWFLMKAGQWNQSHKMVVEHIAPDAIVNEEYDMLKKYLTEFSSPERSVYILDWNIGGEVFLDYIHISETLDQIVKGEIEAYEMERLQSEIMSLCNRISSMTCKTSKERLCQSEMAKKTANLLRAVLPLQDPNSNTMLTHVYAPHLQRLPMPEDYALQELRALSRSYLVEMTC